ncbi:hypothetical protein [Vibrio cholerae]|uniref:hypothetical protein n=1 Tax=Vibrio cholerae TaxID=666 RepID=UPI0011DA37E7|nr:hypothetical protein [Vibrio cholerae]TXZ90267.1 hypothetical protein FXE42_10730 [Vibrio cholerae]
MIKKPINNTATITLINIYSLNVNAGEYFESGDFKNIHCSLANGYNGYNEDFKKHFDNMSYTIQGNSLTTQLYSGVFKLSLVETGRVQFVQIWNDSEIALISIYPNKFVYSTNGSSFTNSRMCIGDVVRYTKSN